MLSSKYVLSENSYVIKRVNEKERFKSPKESMDYRNKLLAPVLPAELDKSGKKYVPPARLVRGKSILTSKRLIPGSKSGKANYLMRTPSKISCGNQCVDGTMTWISDGDLHDYVHTMTLTSVGKVEKPIQLFNMTKGIDFSDISRKTIGCIHRILSQKDNNLIPYNDCAILNIYRDILRKEGLSDPSNESSEIDLLISMAFGSNRLSLDNQIKVLRAYQSSMVDYVKEEYKLSDFEARDKLYNLQGNDLWKGDWWKFTQKFGFSVSEGNITPYKLIELWIISVDELRKSKETKSQRCSIYSCDLLISLLLCIISENMKLGMYGYYYQPRNKIRLKDEQREFCVNAECMETMIGWSEPFQCNTFIDSLEDKMISLKGQLHKKKLRKKTKRRKHRKSKSK